MAPEGSDDDETDALANLAAALTLAVIWDRLDVAEPIFSRMGELAAAGSSGTEAVLRKALQRALELQRVNFTRRLMQLPGAHRSLEQVDMIKLYALSMSKSEFLGAGKLSEVISSIRPVEKPKDPTESKPSRRRSLMQTDSIRGSRGTDEDSSYRGSRTPSRKLKRSNTQKDLAGFGTTVLTSAQVGSYAQTHQYPHS